MNIKEVVILDAVALFHLNKSDPPKILKTLQEKIIKNEIKVVIPAIAILEILWKSANKELKVLQN